MAEKKKTQPGENGKKPSALQKIKLLITIVPHGKGALYIDALEGFGVNMQLMVPGRGSARTDLSQMLGESSDKDVLFSFIGEDKAEAAMKTLNDKFKNVRGGSGIAMTVTLSSMIGVYLYGFLSDSRAVKKGV